MSERKIKMDVLHFKRDKDQFAKPGVDHFVTDEQLIAGISTARKLSWFLTNMRQETQTSSC